MYANPFVLLTTRRFLPLALTQFLVAFNDNLFKSALVILITFGMASRSGVNAQTIVPIAGSILILPFFLFSATAGKLADKYDKAWLSRQIKLVEIFVMLGAVVGFYLDNLYFLLGVLFLTGTQAAFFGPIKFGILPDHLAEQELVAGNALVELTTFIAILSGSMLGGLVVLHANGVLIISILVVCIAILGWVTSLFIPSTKPAVPDLPISYNIAAETWQVLRYISQHRVVLLCTLGISWFWMLGANFLALFPALAKDVIGANEQVVTAFLLMFSMGISVGSLLANHLLKGQIDAAYVPIGLLGISIFSADVYLVSSTIPHNHGELLGLVAFLHIPGAWHLLLSLTLIAVFGGIIIVPLYALLQQQSEEQHRARNIGANNILNAIFTVIGGLGIAGLMEYNWSIPQVFLLTAGLNFAVLFFANRLIPGALERTIVSGILWLLYRVEVRGLDNLKHMGERVLIVPNHLSFLDAFLIGVYVREPLTFAIDTQVAEQWWIRFGLFITKAKTHRIAPTNPLALRTFVACLKNGERVVIFPEGRITVTGNLMKVYDGPALVAERAGAVLLPVHLDGPQYTHFARLQDKVRQLWLPKITIDFLRPRTLVVPAELRGRTRRQYAGNRLYDVMSNATLEGSDSQNTLFKSLLKASKLHGARHVIIDDTTNKQLSYRSLIMASFVLGRAMARASKPEERIGLMLPNVATVVVSFFALHAYGRIPAMLNYSTGVANVLHACRIAQLRIVYTSRKFVEVGKLTELAAAIADAGILVVYLEDVRRQLSSLDRLYGVVASVIPSVAYGFTCRQHNPDTSAVVLFTSGTEGIPKAVVLSHYNLQANRFQVAARIDFTPKDCVFNAMPLFHSFGLSAGTLLPILFGLKVFLYPSPLHYRVIPEMIYGKNATILFSTDTFLTGYAHYANPYDFYSLRLIVSGAERLKEETRRLYSERFGVRIFEGYGVTETAPVLSVNTPMHNRVGTVGRLLPGIEWHVEPVDGIADGGRLLVKGPNVMLGYIKATAPGVIQPPDDGWYDTGDIVSVDHEGYVTIKGRLKRFAKVGGEMVSLAAVEAQIGRLWPKHTHAVVAVPDAKRGERLILATDYAAAQRDELVAFARNEGVADIAVPKTVLKFPALPVLSTGKLDYVGIRSMVDAVLSKA